MNFAGLGLDAARAVCGVGPLARILRDQPDEIKTQALAAVAEAIAPYAVGDQIQLPASVWLVTARAS